MAHKKGGGSSRNNRDSKSKRLGIKKFGGEYVLSGNIIVRQRGTKVHPGEKGMLVWAKIIRFLRRLKVLFILRRCQVGVKKFMSLPSLKMNNAG